MSKVNLVKSYHFIDLDIHQLEFMMINSENRTQQEETMLLIRKES